MFNWLKKKKETPSLTVTAPVQERSTEDAAIVNPPPAANATTDDAGNLVDAALDRINCAVKDKPAAKQKLLALITKGMPQESLLAVLDALAASPVQIPQIAPQPQKEPSKISDIYSEKFPPADFYEFLAWVEDTEQYQRLYADAQGQPPPDTCCFCGGDPDASASITLLNGWRVHEKCYSLLTGNLKDLKSVLEAKILFDASPNVMSAFRFINTWWPGSPPDWEVRGRAVISRAGGKCEDCGKPDDDIDDMLETYHIKPIENGGNHAMGNLICLCGACRSQYALDETLGTEDENHNRKTYLQRKMDLLDLALKGKKDVQFTYRDDKGVVSIRTIRPKEWEDREGVPYIVGFCYLLNDRGAFNLRAMTGLEII